jgi:hypothetical protein
MYREVLLTGFYQVEAPMQNLTKPLGLALRQG